MPSLPDIPAMALGRTIAADTSAFGGIERWVNINAIQVIAHHTSAVVVSVVLFWFVGFIVQRLMHDTLLKKCVLVIDEVVLLCLFVYFAYEMFLVL